MSLNIAATIIGALVSLLGAGMALSSVTQRLLATLVGRAQPQKPYSQRLAELTESLQRASREVDAVLIELADVAKDRAQSVQQLETDLAALESQEKELKERIGTLQNTPLAVAEHFAQLVAPGEKRSAMRDYSLFGAGVVVSTTIGVAIQMFLN
ncbi:MAG: hypothetical protein H6907_18860 [Hyphomicrobiales bacterium]|nr:hypothetical protein [Hyphomicrobiales bacterium]MCP5373796.1 hypothetical protein [Hyphomicrobiales bacterium]